jgi:hypothetical protein
VVLAAVAVCSCSCTVCFYGVRTCSVCIYSVYKHTAPTFSDRQQQLFDLLFVQQYGIREIQSHTLPVPRTSLKQALMHPPCLNGQSAASRVSATRCCERFAGIVIFTTGTSQRAKLRSHATVGQPARQILPRRSHTVWRCHRPRLLTKIVTGQPPLHTADRIRDKKVSSTCL